MQSAKWQHYLDSVIHWLLAHKWNISYKNMRLNFHILYSIFYTSSTNVVNFLIDFTGFVLKILLLQVFQCLLIGGENAGKDAIRNAEGMVVTSQEFKDFCERHKNITSLVPESNEQVIWIIQLSITVTKIGLNIYMVLIYIL